MDYGTVMLLDGEPNLKVRFPARVELLQAACDCRDYAPKDRNDVWTTPGKKTSTNMDN